MDVPPCEYRVLTQKVGVYYCRHTAVAAPGNQVTFSVCRLCPARTLACENPRPHPTEEELAETESPSLGRKGGSGDTPCRVPVSLFYDRLTSEHQPQR